MCSYHWIWLDLEMTGLNPGLDRILEIATLVTDDKLNVVSTGPSLVIHQSESQLLLMDEWNIRTHSSNGLLEQVRSSQINESIAADLTIEFLKNWVPMKKSPICGSSISQDRRFLLQYMPELEAYFNYRCLDVSSIKELVFRWKPDLLLELKLHKLHRALEDIHESVLELKYYREHFIRL